jgi:hypothetical protein
MLAEEVKRMAQPLVNKLERLGASNKAIQAAKGASKPAYSW